jgi:hypothetical protein
LAERTAGNSRFQIELARHYAEKGNYESAATACSRTRALFEQQLAKEPENATLATELAELLLVDTAA